MMSLSWRSRAELATPPEHDEARLTLVPSFGNDVRVFCGGGGGEMKSNFNDVEGCGIKSNLCGGCSRSQMGRSTARGRVLVSC